MLPPSSPVPSINIHYAEEELPVIEPASPFDRIAFASPKSPLFDAAQTNGAHLKLPSVLSPKQQEFQQQRRDTFRKATGQGLDPVRFDELLRTSRNQVGKLDLRKEIALKAHQSKQVDRRALFLSKIDALPSPTATSMPVTPPESPAVFHFTLPSPGLVSPLALFETLQQRPVRIEQVDFRAKAKKEAEMLAQLTGNIGISHKVHGLGRYEGINTGSNSKKSGRKGLPSLDEIQRRLGGNITITRAESPEHVQDTTTTTTPAPIGRNRLPAFLKRQPEMKKDTVKVIAQSSPASSTTTVRPTTTTIVTPKAPQPIARPTVPVIATATTSAVVTPATGAIAKQVAIDELKKPLEATKPLRPIRSSTRPASLSSLAAITQASPSVKPSPAPTPLTAQALEQLAERNERGNAMVERLKRRVSAPAGGMKVTGRVTIGVSTTKAIPGGF